MNNEWPTPLPFTLAGGHRLGRVREPGVYTPARVFLFPLFFAVFECRAAALRNEVAFTSKTLNLFSKDVVLKGKLWRRYVASMKGKSKITQSRRNVT